MMVFGIHHTHPQYNRHLSADFVETTLRVGVRLTPTPRYTVTVRGALGAVRGDSEALTFLENETETLLDQWNVAIRDPFGMLGELTVGRQDIGFGDGFVVWDGATDQATGWTADIRSMTGAKWVYRAEPYALTVFAAQTNRDYLLLDGLLHPHEGRSRLYGGHLAFAGAAGGLLEAGGFLRHDDSDLDNDTLAMSLRGSYPVPHVQGLELAGELVRQTGTTSLHGGLATASHQDREAWGGHADLIYRWPGTGPAPRPYVKLSRVQFSGDDPNTTAYEGYDPLFFGWVDWGKWYVGSISAWELFNSNERVNLLEFGGPLSPVLQARMIVHDFKLDRERTPGAGRNWSREVNLVFDWLPKPDRVIGLAVNHARPRAAAEAFAGDDAPRTEIILYTIAHF
ncbi:hypothetical protein [Immundisolibacter sp.]